MITFECPRCLGKGHIKAFTHVLGGVCFKCNGTGTVTQKAKPSTSTLFRVSIETIEGSTLSPVFNKKGRTAAACLKAAQKQLARGTYNVSKVWVEEIDSAHNLVKGGLTASS